MQIKVYAFCALVFASILKPSETFAQSETGNELCSLVPYLIEVAYAYVPVGMRHFEVSGWWRLLPGKCLKLDQSKYKNYYIHAKVSEHDAGAQHFDSTGLIWFRNNDPETTLSICLPTNRGFQRHYHDCHPADVEKKFYELVFEPNNKTIDLSLGGEHSNVVGGAISSYEEASLVAESVREITDYVNKLKSGPVGSPYKLGVYLADTPYGVAVWDTIDFMPARGYFQKNDIIESFNGQLVNTVADLEHQIQKFGYLTPPRKRYGFITFHRDNQRHIHKFTPCHESQLSNLCLEYFKFLDPRADTSLAEAVFRSVSGGIFWGFEGETICALKKGFETIDDARSSENIIDCFKRKRLERELLEEIHPDITQIGVIAGSFTSPRFIHRALLSKKAKKSVASRVGADALDEGLQGLIAAYGFSEPLGEVTSRKLVEDFFLGAAIGGAVSLVAF